MAALKKITPTPLPEAAPAVEVRVVTEAHAAEPIASPAHELQQVLRDAGYRTEGFRARPMSNAMLVLSLICVYALSMMMLFGSFTV